MPLLFYEIGSSQSQGKAFRAGFSCSSCVQGTTVLQVAEGLLGLCRASGPRNCLVTSVLSFISSEKCKQGNKLAECCHVRGRLVFCRTVGYPESEGACKSDSYF